MRLETTLNELKNAYMIRENIILYGFGAKFHLVKEFVKEVGVLDQLLYINITDEIDNLGAYELEDDIKIVYIGNLDERGLSTDFYTPILQWISSNRFIIIEMEVVMGVYYTEKIRSHGAWVFINYNQWDYQQLEAVHKFADTMNDLGEARVKRSLIRLRSILAGLPANIKRLFFIIVDLLYSNRKNVISLEIVLEEVRKHHMIGPERELRQKLAEFIVHDFIKIRISPKKRELLKLNLPLDDIKTLHLERK